MLIVCVNKLGLFKKSLGLLFGNGVQTAPGIESWNPQSFQKCAGTCVRVQMRKFVQLHLNTLQVALRLLFLWVLACKYACKYLPSTSCAPRLALGSGDWQINKSLRLIFLKANYVEQHNLLVLIVQENNKTSWPYLGLYMCLVLLCHQSHQPGNFHGSPVPTRPFCINCQYLDQIFTLLRLDHCSRLHIHFELPILSPLLSPLFFNLSIWHCHLLNINLRWCRAQLHSKMYL